MKIGIDIRNIGRKRTGDEVVFFNLTKNLALIDSKNNYQLFTDNTDQETLEKIKNNLGIESKNNFEIISLATKNKFTWNFWTLPNYLRCNPVDIYLTQYITPFFVSKKIKIATIIHDVSFKAYPEMIKKSDLFFLNLLIPLSIKRADKVIGVSKFTQDEIIKCYKTNPEKVTWIHNAVADDFCQLADSVNIEKIKLVKEKYALPEIYILYIGTLQPRKNLVTLVEAFSILKADNIKLVLAGGKGHNYDSRIDETIKKYNLENEVFMPGFIDEKDKAAVISGAQVFCFPSLYEGFGIPILEAMTVKTPVVASDIAPHREIAGDAALFFEPRKAEELAEKIALAIKDENLRKTLGEQGTDQMAKFSWIKTAKKMRSIFESLVD